MYDEVFKRCLKTIIEGTRRWDEGLFCSDDLCCLHRGGASLPAQFRERNIFLHPWKSWGFKWEVEWRLPTAEIKKIIIIIPWCSLSLVFFLQTLYCQTTKMLPSLVMKMSTKKPRSSKSTKEPTAILWYRWRKGGDGNPAPAHKKLFQILEAPLFWEMSRDCKILYNSFEYNAVKSTWHSLEISKRLSIKVQ